MRPMDLMDWQCKPLVVPPRMEPPTRARLNPAQRPVSKMTLDGGLIAPEDGDIDIVMRACHATEEEIERPATGEPVWRLAASHRREGTSQLRQLRFERYVHRHHVSRPVLASIKRYEASP